jgi:hypothetical protein
LIISLAWLTSFVTDDTSYAIDNTSDPSWTSQYPDLFSLNSVKTIPPTYCSHALSLEDISGETDKQKICVSRGDTMSFGFDAGIPYKAYVKFANDLKMHRVYGACTQYDSCLYLPSTDMMVMKQNIINGIVRSLVIYKNYSKRLSSFVNPANMALEYIFDVSNPDYVFKSLSGYAWPIGGMGVSDDEKWLAIEFRERGIGLLNLETLEMKRISTMSFSYGTGYDPTSELAVSNGGKSIAIMGLNSGATIFENNDNCGDIATDTNMSSVFPIIKPCASQPIRYWEYVNRFLYAIYPRFTNDGYGLDFYAGSYNNDQVAVSLRAAGSNTEKLEYLALGDSYSSGEGEYNDQYYLDGTNEEYEKCHVSSRSYPFVLADFSKLDLNLVKSVACSGAETKDVVGDDGYYLGQNERLGKNGRNLNDADLISAQSDSIVRFLPGRVHQINFVKNNLPKIITIGVGGNDVGMVSKLQTCLGPGTCNWASDPKMREQFALEIKKLFNTLVSTYQEIHNSSPSSKIFAVGYPRPADGSGVCGPLTGFLLDNDERTFMTEAISYLNQVVKAAAEKVGIGFLDIQSAYGNHVMCGSESPSGINSVAIGDDIGFSGGSSWIKFIGNESFHPNPYGHLLAATYIFNSIGDISRYDYCADKLTICSHNISAPEPSAYWIGETHKDYPSLVKSDFVFDGPDQKNQLQKTIILPSFSFIPNSQAQIEINSTPTKLGAFDISSDGSLSATVNLPSDLEEGFHTIFIHGKSYSGDSVDLYQVIKYQKECSDIENIYKNNNNLDIVSETSINDLTNNLLTSNDNIAYAEVDAYAQENRYLKQYDGRDNVTDQSDSLVKKEVLGLSISNNPVDREGDSNISVSDNIMVVISTACFFVVFILITIKLIRKK